MMQWFIMSQQEVSQGSDASCAVRACIRQLLAYA
jgi:hypothetical protein